jgi:hypothetical protein
MIQSALSLFAECPLPGCKNLTEDPREPCGECREAFGDRLRLSGQEVSAGEAATAYAERDACVAAAYAAQRDLARWSA